MELLRSINEELKAAEELERLEEAGMLKKAAGKVLSKVGMKGKGANLQAQGEADQQIKQLNIELNKWAGSQGKSVKQIKAKDLHKFLKAKGLVAPSELEQAGNTPLAKIMPLAKKAMATSVKSTPLKQTRQASKGDAVQSVQQPAQQQGQQQTQQTFKAYVDKMEQLLAQMKQAVPA